MASYEHSYLSERCHRRSTHGGLAESIDAVFVVTVEYQAGTAKFSDP